jgi:hypothetical protein
MAIKVDALLVVEHAEEADSCAGAVSQSCESLALDVANCWSMSGGVRARSGHLGTRLSGCSKTWKRPRISLGRVQWTSSLAIVACFYNVAVMREPVEQRGRHFCITKHTAPFGESQIGGDDAGSFVELTEQVEQQPWRSPPSLSPPMTMVEPYGAAELRGLFVFDLHSGDQIIAGVKWTFLVCHAGAFAPSGGGPQQRGVLRQWTRQKSS